MDERRDSRVDFRVCFVEEGVGRRVLITWSILFFLVVLVMVVVV